MTIVLATYGTLGDLHPYLAIGRELRRRGHEPVIATSESYRSKVEASGLAFAPIRPDANFDDIELHRRLTEPRRGLERVIRELMLPALGPMYDDLLAIVERTRAEMLVSQILIFAAPLIAEKTGLPWISTELQPGAFMSAYDPPVMAPAPQLAKLRALGPAFHRLLFSVAKRVGRSWGRPVHELRRSLGLKPGGDPLFEGRHSSRLALALFSEVIGPPQPDWPPNTVVTGFPFYDEGECPRALIDFLEDGEAPLVFTLGSSAVRDAGDFYTESIEAARLLGRRAVLLAGDAASQIRSDRSVIVSNYAPYGALFPRAVAIVHHGGVGTTGQALRAGKPMLVVPIGGDQPDNAARTVRLGVARTIARDQYRARRVAAELARLLSDRSVTGAAGAIGARVRAEDGVRSAAAAIEAQLRQ